MIERTKVCFTCKQELPIDNFGFYRARKDGRNLYCKTCVLEKVHESRQRKREMKAAKKASRPVHTCLATQVKGAVAEGCNTREAIKKATKLEWDDLGDALAELTFTKSELRIVRIGSKREFHLAA